jgi:hypothetical protein
MPSTIQEYGKLSFNWNLWGIQIVVEDVVVAYLLKDAIEGGWVHTNFGSELVNILFAPSHELMDLRNFGDIESVKQDSSGGSSPSKLADLFLNYFMTPFQSQKASQRGKCLPS